MSRWIIGEVIRHTAWTSTLFSIYIRAPIEPFIAGQFTQIGVKQEEKMLFRPYSFVNPPDDEILEFFYNIVPEGILTPLLVKLKPGDPIWVSHKAAGRFTLEQVGEAEHLWLLSTGTGSSPFLSLLRTPLLWKRFSKVIWAHSVRHAVELTHQPIIEALKKQYQDRFHFIPIVTRETNMGMLHQRLPILIRNQMLEMHSQLTLSSSQSQVMLCGNPSMIKEVTTALEEKGFQLAHPKKPGNILIENYWKA
jgi:ferredoxin/flavodoxin---NADP+ reductase